MVSALSSRLSIPSTCSSSFEKNANVRKSSVKENENHSRAHPQNIVVDLNKRNRRFRASISKRRRISDEEHYNVSAISSDLKCAGLPCPSLAPDVANNKLIDLSVVQHLFSSQYANNDEHVNLFDDYAQDCKLLIDLCRPAYALRIKIQVHGNNSDVESDLSSDVDSGNEDGNKTRAGAKESSTTSLMTNDQLISRLSLTQALSLYAKPRIITHATHPFIIIHANAAFLRLTAAPSDEILGFPFDTILASSINNFSLKSLLSQSGKQENTIVDVVINSFESCGEKIKRKAKCSIDVSPVVSDMKKAPDIKNDQSRCQSLDVTHFVIDFLSIDDMAEKSNPYVVIG